MKTGLEICLDTISDDIKVNPTLIDSHAVRNYLPYTPKELYSGLICENEFNIYCDKHFFVNLLEKLDIDFQFIKHSNGYAKDSSFKDEEKNVVRIWYEDDDNDNDNDKNDKVLKISIIICDKNYKMYEKDVTYNLLILKDKNILEYKITEKISENYITIIPFEKIQVAKLEALEVLYHSQINNVLNKDYETSDSIINYKNAIENYYHVKALLSDKNKNMKFYTNLIEKEIKLDELEYKRSFEYNQLIPFGKLYNNKEKLDLVNTIISYEYKKVNFYDNIELFNLIIKKICEKEKYKVFTVKQNKIRKIITIDNYSDNILNDLTIFLFTIKYLSKKNIFVIIMLMINYDIEIKNKILNNYFHIINIDKYENEYNNDTYTYIIKKVLDESIEVTI